MKAKVAVVQMSCVLGDVDANLAKVERLTQKAAESGADWVVFPELFNTGYCVASRDHELAERIPGGKTCGALQKLAKRHGVLITGSIMERSIADGVLFNTAITVFPEGDIKKYHKVHLWGDECLRWKRGCEYPEPFSWKDWKVGMQICYEAGIPEGARFAALRGANVLVYSAAFGDRRRYAWELGTQARALENGCYVIACNRFGQDGPDTVFASHSRVIAPDGSVIAETEREDDILVAEIDTEQVVSQRRTIPYLRDLNTAVFKEFWRNY